MKISQTHLVEATKELRKIVPKNPSQHLFSCIKITLDAEGTHLEASNGCDIHGKVSILAPTTGLAATLATMRATREGGCILAPANLLIESAKLADANTEMDITPTDILFQINGQSTSVSIGGYDAADFPPEPNLTAGCGFRLNGEAIKRTLPFASKDETRFILNSVYWQSNKLIATDGRRLHIEGMGCECPRPNGAIIPSEVCRLLVPDTFEISFSEESASACYKINSLNARLTFKLKEGSYPNYQAVIPEKSGNSFTINREICLSTLRKIITATKGKTELKVTPSANAVAFCVHSENLQAPFTLPAIIKGTPEPALFDTAYFMQSLDAGLNTFDMRDGVSPALITGPKDKLHILMPLRSGKHGPAATAKEAVCA